MNRIRGVARAAALAIPVLLAVGSLPDAAGQEPPQTGEFVLGAGGASGTVASARIYYAGLSIPVPIGQTASTYEGRRARALGSVVSASAVSGLTGTPIEGTTPVVVDSQGEVQHLETSLGAPQAGTVSLDASDTPAASADVHLVDLDVPGLIRVEGGHSSSRTHVEAGAERVAEASVTIASIALGGGQVELRGLRWDASHRSGAGPEPETAASFTLGELRIGGVPRPLPAGGAELDAVVELANLVLATAGLSIILPEVRHLPDGSVDIGALRVAYGNSILGTEVIGPLLGAARPLLLPVLDAVVAAAPELGIATLLLDLGLGVADGSGGAELSLGGVNAMTDGTVFGDPLGGASIVTPEAVAPEVTIHPPGPVPLVEIPTLPAGIPVAPVPTASPPQLTPAAAAVAGSERCALAASPRRAGECRLTNEAAALAVAVVAALGIGAYEIAIRRRRADRDVAGAAVE